MKRKTQTFASPLGEGVSPKFSPKNPPNLAKNMINYDKLRAIPKPQKTLGNPHFMGNPRVLTTFSLMRLLSHLFCELSELKCDFSGQDTVFRGFTAGQKIFYAIFTQLHKYTPPCLHLKSYSKSFLRKILNPGNYLLLRLLFVSYHLIYAYTIL